MTTEQSEEASKNKGEKGLEMEFEVWWLGLLKRVPSYYKEYEKIKRLCWEAFLAGRSSA